jgi:hypothetical protein
VTRTQAINQLITNNTRLTHVVTDHRQSLGQSLIDLRAVAATLQASQSDTSQLLDQGAPLLQQTADIVASQKTNLDCDLHDLGQLIDLTSTPRKVQELTTLLDVGPTAFGDVWSSLDVGPGPAGTDSSYSGPWIRVGLTSNPNNGVGPYPPNPNDSVDHDQVAPPPPAVGPCQSRLRPDAVNYRPTNVSAQSTLAGPLPTAAGDVMLGLSGALAAMAVLRRRAFLPAAAASTR